MTTSHEPEKIPVTVLTGYIGAGKTTLLNRILSEPHGKRYAVVVNEFGEIGIDNELVIGADEEVFEMNNGCICCTVRGDLIRIIEGLMKRKGRFDAIIVETTGLADPAPVAQTFFVDEDVREAARLDAVVTVADAKWLAQRLRDAPEAKNQIAFADVIILNKTDLVSPAELREVEARIRAINPYAALHRAKKCDVALADVLERRAFDPVATCIIEREIHLVRGVERGQLIAPSLARAVREIGDQRRGHGLDFILRRLRQQPVVERAELHAHHQQQPRDEDEQVQEKPKQQPREEREPRLHAGVPGAMSM